MTLCWFPMPPFLGQLQKLLLVFGATTLAAGALTMEPGAASRPAERVVVGAIRWDAWHGDASDVGKEVERNLSPRKWQGRAPFFAQFLGPDKVRIDGANQAVLDREIRYARQARLDYWAFLLYADGSAMNHGLEHYLASRNRRGLKFCLILEQGQWATQEAATKQFERVAALTAHADYQRVAGGRPLLYILTTEPGDGGWGSQHGRAAVDQLRAMAQAQSHAHPYIVVMDYRSQRADALRRELNGDGVSAYAYQLDGKNAPYAQLAQEVEHFWDDCRRAGSAVVPIVMTGWDRRPRVEQPVFWETWQKPNAGIEKFYAAPTAEELSQHSRHALEWVAAHPDGAAGKAILIYAWNENDEGGWLVPTKQDGTSRLRAIGGVRRDEH